MPLKRSKDTFRFPQEPNEKLRELRLRAGVGKWVCENSDEMSKHKSRHMSRFDPVRNPSWRTTRRSPLESCVELNPRTEIEPRRQETAEPQITQIAQIESGKESAFIGIHLRLLLLREFRAFVANPISVFGLNQRLDFAMALLILT